MTELLEAAIPRLRCPDDSSCLSHEAGCLVCTRCGRTFPIVAGNAIDLLPSAPAPLKCEDASEEYVRYYLEQFSVPFKLNQQPGGWGGSEAGDATWRECRVRHRTQVFSLLPPVQPGAVGCDFSGGAGFYSLELASRVPCVLHCDLSTDAVSGARFQAEQAGIKNMLFLRMDYLRPPFDGSLDVVLCLDTLIRGAVHERLLLAAIRKSLARGGRAVIDFHNWWHNPIRALGWHAARFRGRSYSQKQAKHLLRACGIEDSKLYRFHQECDSTRGLPFFASRLVPATRLIYRLDSR